MQSKDRVKDTVFIDRGLLCLSLTQKVYIYRIAHCPDILMALNTLRVVSHFCFLWKSWRYPLIPYVRKKVVILLCFIRTF